MTLERYSHVMHLTSQVSGELVEGKGPIDVLRATLPAGTVSGAPKVRAMEIIDELEPTKRGPYAGVVGYFDFSGNLDTAIAIRTMIVTADGRASVQAGAGIVADSDPEAEDLECRNKAAALLAAVPAARRMTGRRTMDDGTADYWAFRHEAGAVWLPRDFVQVAGPEAEAYLQGQLSQDVAASAGASAWSFLLQPQGKVDALVRVVRHAPDRFTLDVDGGFGDAVLARLSAASSCAPRRTSRRSTGAASRCGDRAPTRSRPTACPPTGPGCPVSTGSGPTRPCPRECGSAGWTPTRSCASRPAYRSWATS